MRPWRVALGLTVTAAALAAAALWAELSCLRPYWGVVLAAHGWYVAVQGGIALVTFAALVYMAARGTVVGRGRAQGRRG